MSGPSPLNDGGPNLIRRLGPVLIVVGFAALILFVTAAEEPFNIDELRQTRHYGDSLERVIDESFLQEQPPLDPLLNALAQRVLGVGDVRQRLLSIIFGMGSILVIGVLSLRARLTSIGAATAAAVMAVAPILTSVTAYARPYALPLFLMLCFLLLSDLWLSHGHWSYLCGLTLVALLIPLARTVEPVIFLVLIVVAMAVAAVRQKSDRWRTLAVAGAALGGLVVAAGVLARLGGELTDRTGNTDALSERLLRLLAELPVTLGSALPFWPLLLIAVGLVCVVSEARTRLFHMWWWWILAGTALGFAGAFFVVAPASQMFAVRYVFSWVPSIAVLIGLLVSVAQRRPRTHPRIVDLLTLLLVISVLGWAGLDTARAMTTRNGPDWKSVSRVVAVDLPDDTTVIFDSVVPLGSYRTPFAGYPRYTGDKQVPMTLLIVQDPSLVVPGGNTVMVLLTKNRIDVSGWVPVSVDGFFTVYVPESPRPGLEGAAAASEEFAAAMEPSDAAALRLTAAALWLRAGEDDKASSIMTSLMKEADLRPQILEAIKGSELEMLIAR